MFVGIARYDFLVPGSTSLKDKRQVVRHIVGGLRTKFNAGVAEVDHQELRQRGAIAVSCVSESSFHAKKMLMEMERYMRNQYAIEVLGATVDVVSPDDA
ncbi:MAG TPA: DUF503 domain-containing protein [Actinomycetota bacterium]|nr:DUF503 domain-containing protein [Actinomycetota bacterium]HMC04619.1 DUF503 domain-containing protein [Actinomycetota bacterium]